MSARRSTSVTRDRLADSVSETDEYERFDVFIIPRWTGLGLSGMRGFLGAKFELQEELGFL
jgi:hypothetical protein